MFLFFWSGKEAPSCFDNILNQGEEQIDCGGAFCSSCIESYFEDIQVISSNLMVFEGRYDVLAKIKNSNSQQGVSNIEYKFKFYDKDNNFISEEKGKSYILAGETKYVVKSNLDIIGDPVFVKFEIEPVKWEEQKRTNIKLPIFSKKYESSTVSGSAGVSQVTGIIENQSNYSFVAVDLVAILLDKDDNYLAINQTKINNLRAGERRKITMPWFSKIDGGPVAKVIMEATVNAMDDSNILR